MGAQLDDSALVVWEEGRGGAEDMGLTPPVGVVDPACRTPLSPPVCRSLHVCILGAVALSRRQRVVKAHVAHCEVKNDLYASSGTVRR